jgi:peptidoglycan/xylan/chitin deacetylase (PgdA/CDA1 family)
MREVLVLCYHGVSETWPAKTAVTPARLEEQLATLVRLGYRGATFLHALTAPTAARTLVVTFDDALRSVLECAFPILSRLGLPATVFVPTAYADEGKAASWPGYDRWMGTEHEHELASISWHELRHLAEAEWEIASHTRSHPRLTQIDDRGLEAELTGSRADCEARLGRRCDSLAYPYSDYDHRVVRATRDAGYVLAATVPLEPREPLPLQWPRVGVYRGESTPRILLRAGTRRVRPSRALGTVFRLRQMGRQLGSLRR